MNKRNYLALGFIIGVIYAYFFMKKKYRKVLRQDIKNPDKGELPQ